MHEVLNYNVKVMTAVYKRHFKFLHSLFLPSLTRSHPRKPDETKRPSRKMFLSVFPLTNNPLIRMLHDIADSLLK